MILGQIGEDAHRVADAIHPVQRQRVGGDLHHHMGAARIPHPGKELLDLKGLRRGPLRGEHLAADHVLVGADQAHLGPRRLLQNRLEQVGGGGLAVGAGDGHHGHIVRRMAEVVGAHHRQGPAGVRHLDIGDLRPSGSSSHSTAAAPAAAALPMKVWPSMAKPVMATNRSPGCVARES